MILSELLKTQISLLPNKPGVYLMKDKDDKIIYIGKAKNLKNRVSQYFLRPQSGKVFAMVSHVDHFETIVVHNEKESLILEMNLIQTHYPRYNIMLVDDSHYPYIALKKKDDCFLKIARNTKDNTYNYFGPFPNSGSARDTIDLLNKLFPTRKCKTKGHKKCLYYSLGECLGPCEENIPSSTFGGLYASIKSFLNGDTSSVSLSLKDKMNKFVEAMNYEGASEIKKLLDSLEQMKEKQNVELKNDFVSKDVIATSSREGYMCLAILTYRKGRLLGKKTYVVPSFGEEDEQASELLEQYYLNFETPKEIVTGSTSIKENLEDVFKDVTIIVPKEGRLLETISIASLNAKEAIDAHFASARLEDDKEELLIELGKTLGIDTPYVIELFDNSHLMGSSPVGAMVNFTNGVKCKKNYRKFHLDKQVAGDDFHSMKEVISRRYSRLKEENGSYPSLILVDGGITQVNAAKEALSEINVLINVAGLYKNSKHETEGLIDVEGKLHPLDKHSSLFFFLMRMQDEVHRFAISFHKSLRKKNLTKGILDDIEGLGEKRKELLTKTFDSLDLLKKASLDDISQLLPKEIAIKVYNKLHS